MEYIFALFLLLLASLDRFYLKRRDIEIQNIFYAGEDDNNYRFAISFSISQALKSSSIIYTLRDTKNPSMVVSGKPRTLEFSELGGNEEYLLFPKRMINSGLWVLDVKVSSHDSAINPLYKLFPITKHISREFFIPSPLKENK